MITDRYPGRQWKERFALWDEAFERQYYTQMEKTEIIGFVTKERLTLKEAQQRAAASASAHPFLEGASWGRFWEYGWFFVNYTVPESQDGQELVFLPGFGKEMLIWVDGREAGSVDLHHTWVTVARHAVKGQKIRIAAECYAGHGPRREDGGFCPKGHKPFADEDTEQLVVEPSFVAVWQEKIFQAAMDYKTLYSLLSRLLARSLRELKVTEGLERFLCRTDFERTGEPLIRELEAADREELKPLLACRNGSTAPLFCIFGQSHLDLAWLWTLEETRRKAARTWSNQLELLDRYPEYRFFLCEPPIPEFLKESYPQLWERVKKKVREGQVFADGAFYVECDANLPCGESLARQLIYGKEWFRSELDRESRVAWLPDTFGFTGALPQLLLQCGVPYFATQKLIRQDPECEPFPYNNFWWEGIDGSRVLAHCFKDYNARIRPADLIDRWQKDRIQQEDIESLIYPFGYGDGGGGANRELVETALRCKDLEGAPRTEWESPEQFFERLEARGTKNIFTGELYFSWHRGTYTAQARTKLGMRRAECLLKEAESWTCLLLLWQRAIGKSFPEARAREKGKVPDASRGLQPEPFPAARAQEMSKAPDASRGLSPELSSAAKARKLQERFRRLWKRLMLMQFHDILPGTGIARVHQEAEKELQALAAECRELLNQAFKGLEELLPEAEKRIAADCADSDPTRFVGAESYRAPSFLESLFRKGAGETAAETPGGNPGNRSEKTPGAASGNFAEKTAGAAFGDAAGNTPWNIFGYTSGKTSGEAFGNTAGKISGEAFGNTAGKTSGYTFGNTAEKTDGYTAGKITAESYYLQSPYLYAEFNRAGEVTLLTDNRGYHWEAAGQPMNRLRLYRNVNAYYDAWELGRMYEQEEEPVDRSGWQMQKTEDEQGRAALSLTGKIGDSTFCQKISFSADGRALEFHTTADWQERHRMLKADFPTVIRRTEWISETAFGVLRRPATRSRQWEKDQYEACCHRFCLLEDGREGLAVLNDCKYGCSAKENSLSLTLLRSPLMPDMHADQGGQQFAYAVLPYSGTFSEAGVPQRAIDFDRISHLGMEMEQRRQKLAAVMPFTLETCEEEPYIAASAACGNETCCNSGAVFRKPLPGAGMTAAGLAFQAESLLPNTGCGAEERRPHPLFFAADRSCHVLPECVKLAENDPEMIALRLYEAAGIPQRVRLIIRGLPGVPEVWETGLPETDRRPAEADSRGIRLDFRAFEVKTVLLRLNRNESNQQSGLR